MRLQSADDLFLTEVQDLYDAEKQLLRTLPRIAKTAGNGELTTALREHVEETRTQINRLEQIFEMLGKKAKSHPCLGMKGIVEEAQEILSEESTNESLHDCAIAGAARKAEHYEMAGYLSAQDTARGLGLKDAAALLAESLEEEKNMDRRLKQLSSQMLKEAQRSVAKPQANGKAKTTAKANGNGSKANGRAAKANGRGGKSTTSNTTTDHEFIRQWAEQRGAQPACVKGTGKKGDTGMIRLDFPGYSGGDSLQPIEWEEWFDRFDANQLALVYQDKTANGETSNFNKLIRREE
ncbi:MAG: ferritin-like domain-containing protein [Bryobacterales bacterium]|nr:ferritin-like domain-containing protein [Bryobacterales bacterium]